MKHSIYTIPCSNEIPATGKCRLTLNLLATYLLRRLDFCKNIYFVKSHYLLNLKPPVCLFKLKNKMKVFVIIIL